MATILVIEDEIPLLASIADTLRFEGFQVLEADNGFDGVALAREKLPDLIISDIRMPQMDGYAVLSALQADPATALIPFIFLTAKSERDHVRHGMNLGADDYITKPFKRVDVLDAVKMRLDKQAALRDDFARRFDQLRNDILRVLPNELRLPLRVILDAGETLRADYDMLSAQELIGLGNTIADTTRALQRTVGNYLLFAYIEIVQADPVRVAQLCSQWVNEPGRVIAEAARERALSVGRDADLSVTVGNIATRVSEYNLRKIVEEVVDNAFKFSAPGTLVQVESSHSDGVYRVLVRDGGDGMDSMMLERVGAHMQFERKLDEAALPGLGLTIARRLCELHGGRLNIRSKIGQGTDVELELPA